MTSINKKFYIEFYIRIRIFCIIETRFILNQTSCFLLISLLIDFHRVINRNDISEIRDIFHFETLVE